MGEPRPEGARLKRARKQRTTRASVQIVERIARFAITLGGGATIVAVAAICVFLAWVVVPLFGGVRVSSARSSEAPDPAARRAAQAGVDEQRRLAWTIFADGTLETHDLAGGRRLVSRSLTDGAALTCSSIDTRDGSLALGFEDGTLRLGTLTTRSDLVGRAELTEALQALEVGGVAVDGEIVVERVQPDAWRRVSLALELAPAVDLGAPLALVDRTELSAGPVVASLTTDGRLSLSTARKTTNLLTGEESVQLARAELPYHPAPSGAAPSYLKVLGAGDDVLLVWRDGRGMRIDARDRDAPREAETFDLLPEPAAEVTALEFLIGKRTLLVGDSLGRVRGWFKTKPGDAGTLDGARMTMGHAYLGGGARVTSIAPSPATRMFAVGDASGEVRLYFATSEVLLATARIPENETVGALTIAPRENLIVARTPRALLRWDLDAPHPEASVAALFRPMWYENYQGPEHVWESSGGTDDFEPKHGLMPLVVGTLKATAYSMLFGVPLALLAAIFSSEFLDRRLRVGVKSTIEIMASLPSVVLGFLAAIVIAPVVQGSLAQTLAAFYTVPCAMLAGAHVWQLLPQRLTLRGAGWPRLASIAATIPLGIAAAFVVAPSFERAFFGGSVEAWLNGAGSASFGAWLYMLVPASAALVAMLSTRFVGPWIRARSAEWTRARAARIDSARFVVALAATLAVAAAAAFALETAGFDPRGTFVDSYVQRNALIVGFVMGFAIIPIIYTLAEDALNSVPSHLRLASLGAGATPWQTAVRVIVPTAASGLFSAVMVGLGRAVGETMIVLMAAGNTPLMEWNAFSGFRTLSANLAVELPEAVENSTHYRTLFLAALTLFAITFVVNTAAEVVRQRFRKRAFQL